MLSDWVYGLVGFEMPDIIRVLFWVKESAPTVRALVAYDLLAGMGCRPRHGKIYYY